MLNSTCFISAVHSNLWNLNRYLYLMSQLTRKTYVIFTVLVLLYSSFFPVTSAIYFKGTKFDGQLLCFIYTTSFGFTMSNFILNAVIPLVIMVSCYTAIVVALCRAKHAVPVTAAGGVPSAGSAATQGANSRSTRTQKVSIGSTVVGQCCIFSELISIIKE